VYELIGQRWVDQGTAFVTGGYDSAAGAASLVARSEADYKHIILQTTIRSSDTYQRQQDTLIVWTEPNGVDYALSFQDPEGCSAVWQFIEDVQQHIHTEGASDDLWPDLGSDGDVDAEDPAAGLEDPTPPGNAVPLSSMTMSGPRAMTVADIVRAGHLPPPQMGFIPTVEKAVRALARTPALKERICEYIQVEVGTNLPASALPYF
jgi:protein phosphatase 4 regulatory subunit 3